MKAEVSINCTLFADQYQRVACVNCLQCTICEIDQRNALVARQICSEEVEQAASTKGQDRGLESELVQAHHHPCLSWLQVAVVEFRAEQPLAVRL